MPTWILDERIERAHGRAEVWRVEAGEVLLVLTHHELDEHAARFAADPRAYGRGWILVRARSAEQALATSQAYTAAPSTGALPFALVVLADALPELDRRRSPGRRMTMP